MPVKLVKSPNNFVLIATGIALLLMALRAGMAAASHYPIPVDGVGGEAAAVALSCTRDAILGTALLFVALRKSRFAGATAVIAATLLLFGVALRMFVFAVVASAPMAFASFRVSWSVAIDLAIAGSLLAPLLFPWSGTANKRVFFWMAITFASATLLIGSLAFLARQ
ncbi:MAG: hypothetical protein ABIP41_09080 [Croceibacterium sp.]